MLSALVRYQACLVVSLKLKIDQVFLPLNDVTRRGWACFNWYVSRRHFSFFPRSRWDFSFIEVDNICEILVCSSWVFICLIYYIFHEHVCCTILGFWGDLRILNLFMYVYHVITQNICRNNKFIYFWKKSQIKLRCLVFVLPVLTTSRFQKFQGYFV